MSFTEIANILQIGFSGFAFLLAGMSYKLLKDETSRKGTGRSTILESISKYTKYTLLMAVLVIVARFSEKGLDYYFEYQITAQKQAKAQTSKEAKRCNGALERLINAETKVNTEYSSLLQAIQEGVSNCQSTLDLLSE